MEQKTPSRKRSIYPVTTTILASRPSGRSFFQQFTRLLLPTTRPSSLMRGHHPSLTLPSGTFDSNKTKPFVAEIEGQIVGYADLQEDGYIDHFFVSGSMARRGVGSALMRDSRRGFDSPHPPNLFTGEYHRSSIFRAIRLRGRSVATGLLARRHLRQFSDAKSPTPLPRGRKAEKDLFRSKNAWGQDIPALRDTFVFCKGRCSARITRNCDMTRAVPH